MNDFNLPNGLSGCQLKLINPTIVRKISANTDYNIRLKKQMEKQESFSLLFDFKKIITPKIINFGINEELFFFDMSYEDANTLGNFLNFASKNDLDNLLLVLYKYFDFFFDCNNFYDFESLQLIIENKINNLKINSMYHTEIDLIYNKLGFCNNDLVIKSFCHGDLTCSNLLIDDKYCYFIDFLDSFIDSILIDIIKLKQDLFYEWFLDSNSENYLKIKQSSLYIWHNLEQRYQLYLIQ